MTTITLQAIKARQDELAQLIAQFEQAARGCCTIPQQDITLANGEKYAGLALNDAGQPAYHLILLPGEAKEIQWLDAKDWAKQSGGELPTRREQSILYGNLPGEFKSEWYWSSEQPAADADYAWCQNFGNGYQGNDHKSSELRARAVRRLTI